MYKSLFVFLLIHVCVFSGFASGETEAADEEIKNTEWVLAVTSLDVSALSDSRKLMGDVILRTLVDSLGGIKTRIRSDDELAYYRDYARSTLRSDAAGALAAKQNERDLLLYRGEPSWRYDRSLAALDLDIVKLTEAYNAVEAVVPLVAAEPAVSLKSGTTVAPAAGGEYAFCAKEKADAFLTGTLSEFHGRVYLTVKMYTLYTRSFSYEDSVLFSSDDSGGAVSELAARLAAAISGTVPAALIVHAEPEDAMILVDNAWAGRGELPLTEHAPGEAVVAVHADNYAPFTLPLEVSSGEITELFFNLTPLSLASFTVDAPGNPGSSVFLGSRFIGKTPLTLELPGGFAYITVETPSGETGTAVYQPNAPVMGSAQFVNSGAALAFTTSVPVSPEEGRVAAARNDFYSAYGRLWIGLPVSLLAMGMAENYINAYIARPSRDMYAPAQTASYVKIGAYVVIGLVAADTIFNIVRYLVTSGANADPIARFDPVIPENQQ